MFKVALHQSDVTQTNYYTKRLSPNPRERTRWCILVNVWGGELIFKNNIDACLSQKLIVSEHGNWVNKLFTQVQLEIIHPSTVTSHASLINRVVQA